MNQIIVQFKQEQFEHLCENNCRLHRFIIWLFFRALSLRWRLCAHKGFVWKPLVLRNTCNAELEKASTVHSCVPSIVRCAQLQNWSSYTKPLLNCLNIGGSDFCVAPFCRKLTHYLCTMCFESISEAEFIERLWPSSWTTMLSAAMKLLDVRSLNAQTPLASATLQLRAPSHAPVTCALHRSNATRHF